VKILADAATDEVLGVHMIGPSVLRDDRRILRGHGVPRRVRGRRAHLPPAPRPAPRRCARRPWESKGGRCRPDAWSDLRRARVDELAACASLYVRADDTFTWVSPERHRRGLLAAAARGDLRRLRGGRSWDRRPLPARRLFLHSLYVTERGRGSAGPCCRYVLASAADRLSLKCQAANAAARRSMCVKGSAATADGQRTARVALAPGSCGARKLAWRAGRCGVTLRHTRETAMLLTPSCSPPPRRASIDR
jgi:hypothetical protein